MFRELPARAALEAMIKVPADVEAQYWAEMEWAAEGMELEEPGDYPGQPWKFYNLALLRLEDFYGTRDPVEALRLLLAQAGSAGHLGQRLAYQGLLGRLWAQADREELLRYVFGRGASGAATPGQSPERFDERLRAQARKLFGPDLSAFLGHHRFDFLHWLLDPDKAALNAHALNPMTLSQLIFLIGYLYRLDPRIGKIWDDYDFVELEHVCPSYGQFIARNLGPLEQVSAYYSWLDSVFFGHRLPSWVCHKDAHDFLFHEDVAPWLNPTSIEADISYVDPAYEGRAFYESEEEPNQGPSLWFWVFGTPPILYWIVHLLVFGHFNAEGSPVIHVEVMYFIERILFNFDCMVPLYGRLVGVSLHNAGSSGGLYPHGPFYEELGESFDFSRGQRWTYSWEQEVEQAKYFYLPEERAAAVWWSDLRPHWALCGGRLGYRLLAALMALWFG